MCYGCSVNYIFTVSVILFIFVLYNSYLGNMADAIRGFWHSIVSTKRTYLNPHEHFGRANICRAALASYVGLYILYKWNSAKKVKALQEKQISEKSTIVNNALARAGLE